MLDLESALDVPLSLSFQIATWSMTMWQHLKVNFGSRYHDLIAIIMILVWKFLLAPVTTVHSSWIAIHCVNFVIQTKQTNKFSLHIYGNTPSTVRTHTHSSQWLHSISIHWLMRHTWIQWTWSDNDIGGFCRQCYKL